MIGEITTWAKAHRWTLAACAASGVAGYGAGRYAAPTKTIVRTETKTETVEVVKWKERIVQVQGPVRVVTRTVKVPGPAGETVTVEKIVERDRVVTVHDGSGAGASGTSTETVNEKTVERDAPRFLLAGTAGYTLNAGQLMPPAFGLLGGVRVAGPVWVLGQGEGGAGPASFRVGVGVSF